MGQGSPDATHRAGQVQVHLSVPEIVGDFREIWFVKVPASGIHQDIEFPQALQRLRDAGVDGA